MDSLLRGGSFLIHRHPVDARYCASLSGLGNPFLTLSFRLGLAFLVSVSVIFFVSAAFSVFVRRV